MPEWMYSVLISIFGNIVYDSLLAVGVAALIAWLRSKQSKWATPLLYGVASFALMLVISFVLTGHALLYQKPFSVNTENVESTIADWTDKYQIGRRRVSAGPEDYFFFEAVRGGINVSIYRERQRDHYVIMAVLLELSAADQRTLDALSQDQREDVLLQESQELARLKVAYQVVGTDVEPIGSMRLEEPIPINDALTEETFMEHLQNITSNAMDASETLKLAMLRARPQKGR